MKNSEQKEPQPVYVAPAEIAAIKSSFPWKNISPISAGHLLLQIQLSVMVRLCRTRKNFPTRSTRSQPFFSIMATAQSHTATDQPHVNKETSLHVLVGTCPEMSTHIWRACSVCGRTKTNFRRYTLMTNGEIARSVLRCRRLLRSVRTNHARSK